MSLEKISVKFPQIDLPSFLALFDHPLNVHTIEIDFVSKINNLIELISQCVSVTSICLRSVNLTQQNLTIFHNLKNLEHLEISHCYFTQDQICSLFFAAPFSLKSLNIAFNHATILILPTLVPYLTRCSQLSSLVLMGNNVITHQNMPFPHAQSTDSNFSVAMIKSPVDDQLFHSLNFYCSLSLLDLTNTSSNMDTCISLKQCFHFSKKLLSLNLSQNPAINDSCCEHLCDVTSLTNLNLSFCSITDIGFSILISGGLLKPSILNLNNNQIALTKFDRVAPCFFLRNLSLGKNPIDVDVIDVLSVVFPALTTLDLHSCFIKSSQKLISLIRHLSLTNFILWDNLLTIKDFISIFDYLGQFNHSVPIFLDLKYNNINLRLVPPNTQKTNAIFDLKYNCEPH